MLIWYPRRGTQLAADIERALDRERLQEGIGFPSVFPHPVRDVWTLVHGDDYGSAGDESALLCIEGVLSKKYKLKTQKVGHLPGMLREGQILNRIVRATSAEI